jgi:hypothetical protein
VAEADSSLQSYVDKYGDTAMRALLTDGAAFCALLAQHVGVDQALVDTVTGIRSVEATTHLTPTMRDLNTLESVALLTLCPASLKVLDPADQAKLRKLSAALGDPMP